MFESTVMLFPIPHPVLQLTDTLCGFLYPEKSRGHLEEIKVEIKAIREKLDALTSLRQENNVEGKFYNSIPQFSHLFSCPYAPIYVKPAGGGGREAGHGWGFDIFQKYAVKFPAHRQITPVKCNQIPPPRAAHIKYLKAGPKKGTIKICPNKTLQSLLINFAASPYMWKRETYVRSQSLSSELAVN